MATSTVKRNNPETLLDNPLGGCWGVVQGDYRSPNGANRRGLGTECHNEATFKVTNLNHMPRPEFGRADPPATVAYCGVHVRRFRKLTGYYRIEEI